MLLRFLIFLIKTFITLSIIGAFTAAYLIFHYSRQLPDYSELKKYYPSSTTRMYSADGQLIEEYAKEHRIFVPINSIPKFLSEAFISAEDKNFYHHTGIDIMSIARAAVSNISNILNRRRIEGGSTITQQVVKNFLLTSERSLERKIKEAILSYMISQTFTKDEILELYLNQIYLGKGAYGVATASLVYFNKSVEELTINEAAVLASMPKAPSFFNPEKNYKRALSRRNYVLNRMAEDGYITKEQAKENKTQPILLAKFDKVETIDADYYAQKVRDEVINMFGEEFFYNAGLTIVTCVDSKLQKAAANALRFGIKKYDMKRGYRGSIKNINTDNWQKKLSKMKLPAGSRDYILAVILDVQDKDAVIGFKDGVISKIFLNDTKWAATNMKSMRRILKIGDVVLIEKEKQEKGEYHHYLRQIPIINGGIIVMDHRNGRVLAAEGGYDFSVNKFDRSNQAKRQVGSLIKPFIYLSALQKGIKPNDIFSDTPIEIYQGPGLPIWKPKNWDEKFLGPVTFRTGIEKSRNTVTVRITEKIGLPYVVDSLKKFGISNDIPLKYSVTLGALESTLSNMTSAFSMIANKGKKVEPHYIELIKDRKGNIIYKRDYAECKECQLYHIDNSGEPIVPNIPETETEQIVDETTAYQMISIMQGGIKRGTGASAKKLKHYIAGKTGTTNKAKDVWFIGFTPEITIGTYVGYDQPRTLGKRAYGATVALPIFVNFMENGYNDVDFVDFKIPDTIELKSINPKTGEFSNEPGSILEAFKKHEDSKNLENNDNIDEEIMDMLYPSNGLEEDESNEIY